MLAQAYTDTCSKKSGLVIDVLDSLSIRNYTNFNTYSTWEGLAVEINYNSEKSITVCNIYRPPRDNHCHASIDLILNEFNPTLHKLNKSSKNIILVGDFSIDLLKLNSNAKFQEFYDSLAQLDFCTSYNISHKILSFKCNSHWSDLL